MYSNFITPPDIVESVLVVNATEEQIKECADACEKSENTYNVYFYHELMKDPEWLGQVCQRVDTILINRGEDNTEVVGPKAVHYFGEKEEFNNPAEYFAK
jgi:hypothetical protein